MDRNKVEFNSDDPVDKIVHQGEVSVTNAGAQSGEGNSPSNRLVTHTISNPYGKNAFVRFKWSYDNGNNWNGQGSTMGFGYSLEGRYNGAHQGYYPAAGFRAHVSVGMTNSQMLFRTVSGYHTTNGIYSDTRTGPFRTEWGGWSPISQTIRIKYWVYERD